jgi:hypothetical protein
VSGFAIVSFVCLLKANEKEDRRTFSNTLFAAPSASMESVARSSRTRAVSARRLAISDAVSPGSSIRVLLDGEGRRKAHHSPRQLQRPSAPPPPVLHHRLRKAGGGGNSSPTQCSGEPSKASSGLCRRQRFSGRVCLRPKRTMNQSCSSLREGEGTKKAGETHQCNQNTRPRLPSLEKSAAPVRHTHWFRSRQAELQQRDTSGSRVDERRGCPAH